MLRERTKDILDEYGIRLSKRRGQSHMVDEKILGRMVDYANISPTDIVLEVGPGIGNLTIFLVERAEKVIAVEEDGRLIETLRDRLGDRPDLEVIHGDILEVELPRFDKVVSNLPYSISSPITFELLEREFYLGVLMYQEEFAQRMVASPGSPDYSRLSVSVSYRCKAELLERVPPDAFIPKPEVWSAVVGLKTHAPHFSVQNEGTFFGVVRAAFQHRRQKIRNSLFHSFKEINPGLNLSDDQKRSLIDGAIPDDLADRRAEDISPKEFGMIANSLEERIKNLIKS